MQRLQENDHLLAASMEEARLREEAEENHHRAGVVPPYQVEEVESPQAAEAVALPCPPCLRFNGVAHGQLCLKEAREGALCGERPAVRHGLSGALNVALP